MVPGFGSALVERRARLPGGGRPGVAGVVDQDLHRPQFGLGARDHVLHGGQVGDVGLDGQRLAARGPDLLGDGFGAVQVEIVDDHAAAVVRAEVQGRLLADALAGAGDDGHLALEIEDVGHMSRSRPFQYGARNSVLSTLPMRLRGSSSMMWMAFGRL